MKNEDNFTCKDCPYSSNCLETIPTENCKKCLKIISCWQKYLLNEEKKEEE